jgi:hypothetical protein
MAMYNDDDWVSNVKRWCHDQQAAAAQAQAQLPESDEAGDMLGYEAAHPMLQAPHWPDA